MIALDLVDLDRLDESYREAIDEFRRALRWVCDRTHAAHHGRYDPAWANLVALLATNGVIVLLKRIAESLGRGIADAQLDEDLCVLLADWSAESGRFGSPATGVLASEIDESIIQKLERYRRRPSLLTLYEDIDHFCSERDAIELFFIGAEPFYDVTAVKKWSANPDREIRNHILNARASGAVTGLKDLNIDWLPAEFWWRHFPRA
jgi:hypothetical protein